MFKALAVFLFCVAVYTQLAFLTGVPGLNFDEAWQGLFSNRIAFEPGFHPWTAMNVYNGAVFHYLLAGVFKVFGTSLASMRGAFAVLNLCTLLIFFGTFYSLGERTAALWFLLLWALLPLSVHDHRFYVELTCFHGFCLSLVFLGARLWRKMPRASWGLLFIGTLLGIYSHILFIAVYLGALATAFTIYPLELQKRRARILVSSLAVLALPLLVTMANSLGKKAPIFLAVGLVLVAIFFALTRIKKNVIKVPSTVLALAALAYLFEFVLLEWNGNWPYAQATGHLVWLWLPINALLFIAIFVQEIKRGRSQDWRHGIWRLFIFVFLATSVMAFKQSSRYYLVPALIAMLWISTRLSKIKSLKFQVAIGICFLTWNFFAFETYYLQSYLTAPPSDQEFHAGPFHDNARDFRPFQSIHAWIVSQNCQRNLPALEDDRFARPMEFLSIGEPEPKGPCVWGARQMFLLHLGQTDRNMHLYQHESYWGDLAIFAPR